jgi:hypothetical protein
VILRQGRVVLRKRLEEFHKTFRQPRMSSFFRSVPHSDLCGTQFAIMDGKASDRARVVFEKIEGVGGEVGCARGFADELAIEV